MWPDVPERQRDDAPPEHPPGVHHVRDVWQGVQPGAGPAAASADGTQDDAGAESCLRARQRPAHLAAVRRCDTTRAHVSITCPEAAGWFEFGDGNLEALYNYTLDRLGCALFRALDIDYSKYLGAVLLRINVEKRWSGAV